MAWTKSQAWNQDFDWARTDYASRYHRASLRVLHMQHAGLRQTLASDPDNATAAGAIVAIADLINKRESQEV